MAGSNVAGDVGFIIESALEARGQALIALPGGTTPAPIYAQLAKAKLDWKRVTIIPTDDRLAEGFFVAPAVLGAGRGGCASTYAGRR